jgi:murein DD-endopeptidase MepM/ murein hydrolase activator NlpD
MQIMITHGRLARTRVLHFNRWQLALGALALMASLMLVSGTIYHFVFLKAAREGWPVVSPLLRLVVRDEFAQRDRFMRENLDAIAQRVGEVQAKLVKLEAMGERVSSLVGVKAEELQPAPTRSTAATGTAAGRGGPYVPATSVSAEQLDVLLRSIDEATERRTDLFTLVESRLLEKKLQSLLLPSSRPVDTVVGSGFGFRADPFTGRNALHTGLDFPADVGTPVAAAAGGVVVSATRHPAYGLVVELDHGRGLVTRYAHNSKVLVAPGDLVKRDQVIAAVGNSGRSTGPHLHFEVLVDGVPQDPAKFLARAAAPQLAAVATAGRTRR